MRSLLAVLLLAPAAFADPLDAIPKQATVVLKIESPRKLVESAVQLDAWKNAQAFPQVKDVLDSPGVRRFFQVLTFVEQQTGAKWPELLDKVAGNGIALGFKAGMDPAPTLAVIEGTDAETVAKVYAIFVAGLKDQAGRDGTTKIVETTHAGVTTLQLGDDAFFAQVGPRIFLANKQKVLEAGLTCKEADSVLANPTLPKARTLIGPAAAWLWFDLATAKETKEGKDFFANTRKELFQLMTIGSTVDAARRSDFLAAGLFVTSAGYKISVRMPAKRSDLDNVMRVHVPANGVGTKPLLEPPGVVLSQSMHLDVSHLWTNRKTVIADEMQRKEIEKGVADLSKFIPGTSYGQLLESSGPHHRFVMAHTGEKLYNKEPGQVIPPVAYVGSMKNPQYGETMTGLLRAAGLVAGFQTGWKMSEAKHDGVNIVTYTFPETDDVKFPDEDRLRFNAAPSFAVVNGSLVIGSTPGIIKSLIPLLKAEAVDAGSPEVWKLRFYAAGAGDVLTAHPDATVTQAVLGQGVTLAEARKQTLDFAAWFRKLGAGSVSLDHGDEYFRFDAEWNYGK